MKHQVLARVFSVVLAILCALLLYSGVKGFGEADRELGERRAYEGKFDGRIQNFVALDAELAGSISYDEARAELEKRLEQHERDASQHRTDTALHTAEKGGNIMGADIIWELMPELKGAKLELEAGKQQLAKKEAAFAKAKPGIEEMVSSGLAACSAEKASLASLAPALNSYLAEHPMPSLPTAPTPPSEPAKPTAPQAPIDPTQLMWNEPDEAAFVTATEPAAPGEDASDEDKAAYEAAYALYEQELAQQQAAYSEAQAAYEAQRAEYEAKLPALQEEFAKATEAYAAAYAAYKAKEEAYPAELEAYNRALEQYQTDKAAYDEALPVASAALQAWQMDYSMTLMGELSPHIGALTSLGSDLSAAGESVAALAAELGGDTSAMDGGTGGMGAGMPSAAQLAGQPPEAIAAALSGTVDAISGGYGQISAGLGKIEAGLAEARGQVALAERELKKAEGELNGQLENIWLNLGELEKEAEELAQEKEALDEEASVLSRKLLENEALKELTNRRNSARQLLLNVPEVKAESSQTGDLPGAAAHWLETYRTRTEELYKGERSVNTLAVAAAAAGLLGIPAAFELTKKRFFLLAPVLVCLFAAAAAEWLHVSLGLGQLYVALFTAIFAAIQLLIVLPKKKSLA